jgi:DNA-binding transcriptional ArsR family regulator
VSSSPLKSVVEHDVRLDMLDCLDGTPLTITEVGDRISRDKTHVGYHMKMLVTFGLVEVTEREGEALYVCDLSDQPAWITTAVSVRGERRGERKK